MHLDILNYDQIFTRLSCETLAKEFAQENGHSPELKHAYVVAEWYSG
jgi:hypothetical protein